MKNPFSALFRAWDKPRNSVSAAPVFYFGTSGAGKSVTAHTAIQLSTVYACVRVISETVASLPLGVYEATGGVSKEDKKKRPSFRWGFIWMSREFLFPLKASLVTRWITRRLPLLFRTQWTLSAQLTIGLSTFVTKELEMEKPLFMQSSSELLEAFLAVKRLEGRSDKTLALYRYNIGMILDISEKNACAMTTDDIRKCLAQYQEEHGVNKATLDNVRSNLSSFFMLPQRKEETPWNS